MHRERFVIMSASENLHLLKSVHDDANDRSLSCEYSLKDEVNKNIQNTLCQHIEKRHRQLNCDWV